MALENLTDGQRKLIEEMVAGVDRGDCGPNFKAFAFLGSGWHLQMEGKHGIEIQGFTEIDLHALQHEGYIFLIQKKSGYAGSLIVVEYKKSLELMNNTIENEGEEDETSSKRKKLVILIHGIRTRAEWQVRIRHLFKVDQQTIVVPIGYGYFDVVQFIFPFRTRRKPIRIVLNKIRDALKFHKDNYDELIIVAHSFGTYIIGTILRENPDIEPTRLLLCGCILQDSFAWDRLPNNRPNIVINEVGCRDIWPIIAKSITWGYGSTGTFGFQCPGVHDRFHDIAHSDYFKKGFAEDYWVPWIQNNDIKPTSFEESVRPPTPFFQNLIGFVIRVSKWVFILAILWVTICFSFPLIRSRDHAKWLDCLCHISTPCSKAGSLYAVEPSVGNMRCVPAGSFTQGLRRFDQGLPGVQTDCECDALVYRHTFKRNIAVMETEVTQQMWKVLKEQQPSLPSDPSDTIISPGMNHPVQRCNWFEAVLFANLLSIQNQFRRCYYVDPGFLTPIDLSNYNKGPFYCDFDANGYRLPTEGEWEYFTRAGTLGPFSCDEPNYNLRTCISETTGTLPTLETYCIYLANSSGRTAPVGSKLPNPWHLFDVHGNVMEWCWDWRGTYPTGSQTDYSGFGTGSSRILRGGAWNGVPYYSSSAYRYDHDPEIRYFYTGFRLVRTIH